MDNELFAPKKKDDDIEYSMPCAHNGNNASLLSNVLKSTDGTYVDKDANGALVTKVTRASYHQLARRRKQAKYLRSYREIGVKGLACKQTGISPSTITHWLQDDPVFAAHFEHITEGIVGQLEQEAMRRAIEGDKTPLVSMGRVVAYHNKKSDDLLKFMLQAAKPDVYRQRNAAGVTLSKDDQGQPMIKAYVGVNLDDV